MSKVITYSIENQLNSSDKFYIEIENFSDEVISNIKNILKEEVHIFIEFIKNKHLEDIRYEEEYLIDFLILSIFYRVYINRAKNVGIIGTKIISKNNKLKKYSIIRKKIKGIASTIFLTKFTNEEVEINLNNIKKLIDYLELTDEFEEESKRINNIYEFLRYYEVIEKYKDLDNIMSKILDIGNYFEEVSKNRLGKYTKKVNLFLSKEHEKHRYKEDVIYTGRLEVEYYLNMVFSTIINKVFFTEFVECKDKILLLPSCMKLHDNYRCRSKNIDYLYSCKGCSKKCKVNELNKIGEKYTLKVYTFSRQRGFNKTDRTMYENKGVIGVGCALNLISTGLKLRELKAKPQCMILSFCGCKKHWHDYGLTTRFSINKFLELIEIEKNTKYDINQKKTKRI